MAALNSPPRSVVYYKYTDLTISLDGFTPDLALISSNIECLLKIIFTLWPLI